MSRIGGLFHKSETTQSAPTFPRKDKVEKRDTISGGLSVRSTTTSFLPPVDIPRFSTAMVLNDARSSTHVDQTVVTEVANATSTIIEQARSMPDGIEKERLLHVSSVLVNAVTAAHESHKAMIEAERAAEQATLSHKMMQLSIEELAKFLRGPTAIAGLLAAAESEKLLS